MLTISHVSKTFRQPNGDGAGFRVLEDVSFEVAKKEFVSILGPSGCGKTTLVRIIAGLIPPDEGQVLVDGKASVEPGRESCLVFQNFGLLPWRSVLGNVEFGLELDDVPKAERRRIAERYIKLVGLEGFERNYPHQISGGMQQRVGIARALSKDPKLLLMDEPFGAVDAQTREELQEQLLRICAETEKTVVFVTHSIDEAIVLSDRIVVMQPRPGRVREIIPVPLPRPRHGVDVHSERQFVTLRREIRALLRECGRSAT